MSQPAGDRPQEPLRSGVAMEADATPSDRPPDLARAALQLLALGVLIFSTFWIVRPFLVAGSWGTMIAIATWPILLRAEQWLGGRRSLAVAAMTIALLLVLLVPFYFAITTIVQNAGRIADWSKEIGTLSVPPLPAWVATLPLVGPRLVAGWQEIVAATPEEISAHVAPFARTAVLWFVQQVGSLGFLLVQLLLTVIVAAILYSKGETAAHGTRRFARRLAGVEGETAVDLAARAVRAVALGVVLTAFLQSVFAGIGLAIVGVPFVAILTALTFILGVAQVGSGLILIPAAFWVYSRSGPVWGTGFLVWAVFCSTFDNFLRPMLIKRGADLPLLLIFTGVIGGLVALGVIGLFIGPVVLAVAYTLLVDWVSETDRPAGRRPPLPAA